MVHAVVVLIQEGRGELVGKGAPSRARIRGLGVSERKIKWLVVGSTRAEEAGSAISGQVRTMGGVESDPTLSGKETFEIVGAFASGQVTLSDSSKEPVPMAEAGDASVYQQFRDPRSGSHDVAVEYLVSSVSRRVVSHMPMETYA